MPCEPNNTCYLTGEEPFELEKFNKEIVDIFKKTISLSSPKKLGIKEEGDEAIVIPTLENLDTVLDNWLTDFTSLERYKILDYIGIIYNKLIDDRVN